VVISKVSDWPTDDSSVSVVDMMGKLKEVATDRVELRSEKAVDRPIILEAVAESVILVVRASCVVG